MSDEHLIYLGGRDGWSLWRWFMLRSTGFPTSLVLNVAIDGFDDALQRLISAEDEVARARTSAIDAVTAAAASTDDNGKRALNKLRSRLENGEPPAPDASSPAANLLDALRTAHNTAKREYDNLVAWLESKQPALREALLAQVREPRFREAVSWQTLHALRTGLDHLLRQAPDNVNSKTRQKEMLAASYLQRYCLKNDTIGFFGPVGWGEIADVTELRDVEGLGRRTVYFEWWAIHELASRIASEPDVRPWLSPRRSPLLRIEDDAVHVGGRPSSSLSPGEVWLLRASDGTRSVRELENAAVAAGHAVDVQPLLRKYEHSQWVQWTLNVPTESVHPDQALRRELERIADVAVRQRWLAALDELVQARDHVAKSAGDPEKLGAALDALGATFTRVSGRRASRNEGEAYAGRGIVYEDCVRGDELLLGRDVIAHFAAPLELVLDSARWFTYTLGQRYLRTFEQLYDTLARQSGNSVVELSAFLAQSSLGKRESSSHIADEVAAELRARWARVLAVSPEERVVTRTPEQLVPVIRELFDAPGPGWPIARYQSPDVMLAATSMDALRRGDFLAVLGELHAAANNVLTPFALKEHPQAAVLLRARSLDVPPPRIAPIVPAAAAQRAAPWSMHEGDMHLAIGMSVSWRAPERVLAVGDLVVTRDDGQLVVRERRGERHWHVLDFFESYVRHDSAGRFGVATKQRHSPRMSIGKLVVARESWTYEPSEIPFAQDDAGARRLLDANRWRVRHALPRFVFLKVPEERKPVYIDFQSPLYVELFAKTVRKASAVVMTEMLPAHGEHWLVDKAGSHYSCELRLGALDPIPFRAPT